jgi:hypothetical protein
MQVVVDVSSAPVKERLKSALSEAGVEPVEREVTDAVARFRDQPGEATPETVHVWTGGRHDRGSNPFASPEIRHVLGARAEVDTATVRSIVDQIATESTMPLHTLLGDNARLEGYRAISSDQKKQLLDLANLFFSGAPQHVKDSLLLGLDELFTNAVYNAPVDDKGKRPNAAVSRSVKVTSKRPITVRFARDGANAAIAVRDEYGSLDSATVLGALDRCYADRQAAPQDKAGGAGLGFYMLLQNSNRLVLNIQPGAFTEVIIVRKLGERRKSFAEGAPTFNVCIERNDP